MKKLFTCLIGYLLLNNLYAQLYINGDMTIQYGVTLYADDSIKLASSANVMDNGILQSTKGILTNNNIINTSTSGYIITPIASGISSSFDIGTNSNNRISILHNSLSNITYQLAVRDNVFQNPETSIGNITNNVVGKTWIVQPLSNANNATIQLNWNSSDELNGFNRHNCGIANWISGNSNAWSFVYGTTAATSNAANPSYSTTSFVSNMNTGLYYFGMGDSSSIFSVYLRSLLLSSGTLSPVFLSTTASYTSSVSSSTNSITVTPTANDMNATIQVRVNNGGYSNVVSGNASSSLNLNVGNNIIDIKVIGSDGVTIKIYSVTVTRPSAITQLTLTAFLEGLYLGNNIMTSAPFNADGVSPNTIADTIKVELHQPSGSYNLAYATIGTLATNGLANINFPNSANGNSYYIVLKHRNSIETWSALPVLFNASVTYYNFSNAITQAFGNNLKNGGAGLFLIYSGDINQDGAIDFNDYPDLDIASSNGELGYLPYDLNGDASVDFNDYPMLDINSSNGVIAITP